MAAVRRLSVTHQENNIVNARFRKLNSDIRTHQDDERIEVFKSKITEDEEEALKYLETNLKEEIKIELLHVAVNNRKNDFIVRVLKEFCFHAESDQTDGLDLNLAGRDMLERAILFATLNDDAETLEDILKWGQESQFLDNINLCEEEGVGKHSPILYACLKDYVKCINVLYRYGYRVNLPEEEETIIQEVLRTNNAVENDYHFYMKLWAGDRHVDQVYYLLKKKKKLGSKKDPVERLLSIKAFANPHYIATEFMENCEHKNVTEKEFCLYDPVRKSLALARYTKFLSRFYVQYSQEYLEISKRCERLATSVLDHCDSMRDVKTILDYSPQDILDPNNDNRNWHLALHAHQKSFVGHHYYQNFLWEKGGLQIIEEFIGLNFPWDNYFLLWKIFHLPFAFLFFLIVPFVVVVDALFRDADIIFVDPEKYQLSRKYRNVQKGDEKIVEMADIETVNGQPPVLGEMEKELEHPFFAYFRARIHRPVLRIIAHHIIELIYLVMLSLTLLDPLDEPRDFPRENRMKQYHFYDYLTIVFISSYLLESFIDLLRKNGHSLSSFSFFQTYNITSNFIMAVGGLMTMISFRIHEDDNRAVLSGNHPINIGSTIFAYGATMSLLKPLRWFLLNRSLGPVVVCIIKVLKDAFHVFLIYFIVFGAFSISSYFMFKPFYLHNDKFKLHQDDLVTEKGVVGAMFWRVLDAGQPHYAAILSNTGNCSGNKETNKEDEFDINCLSDQFSHLMSMAMWAVYQLITVILLINILIAMMNTTYTRIWVDSDRQWKYSKSFYQVQFLFPRSVMPSPFRILYYLVKHLHIFKRKRSKHSEKTRQVETFNKYKQTMVGILTVKLLSDYENSIQEDFQDLRMDLQNHITEKHKTNERTLKSEFNDLKETLTTIEPMDGLKEYIRDETESLRQEIRRKQDDVEELKGEIRELKELVKMLADRGK